MASLLKNVRDWAKRVQDLEQRLRNARLQRDAAIREASAQHSEREIAHEAGISPPAVHRILARRR